MKEDDSRHSSPGPRERGWDISKIGQTLQAPAESISHIAHQQGWELRVGPRQPGTILQLYPAAAVTQLRSDDLACWLYRLEPPIVGDGELLLQAERPGLLQQARITSTGIVSVLIEPLASRPEDQPGPPTPQVDESTPSATMGRRERVTVLGRVGATPRYRTTPGGRLVVRFPLAERADDLSTTWHTVIAFDARAARLQENGLAKGTLIECIAYPHERQLPTKDGPPRTVRELYAAVIKVR